MVVATAADECSVSGRAARDLARSRWLETGRRAHRSARRAYGNPEVDLEGELKVAAVK